MLFPELPPKAQQLLDGPLYHFSDWPSPDVPHVAAGVYTVWKSGEFIYVGMSGRRLTEERIEQMRRKDKRRKALYSRLNSHASGRRSGDQFCIYICDRYVIPHLSPEERQQLHEGASFLDRRTRAFIHQNLSYRFIETKNGKRALQIERAIQKGALPVGKPAINPL